MDFFIKSSTVLSIKDQHIIMDEWLNYRLKNILPELMKREGIDMWIVLAREYNEDPIYPTLVPALDKTASRLSCLIFCMSKKNEVECLSLCRPSNRLEKYYGRAWDFINETQWECITRLIEEKNPSKIGVNISKKTALADGLTKSLYDELLGALGSEYSRRLVSAESLCISWLEIRSQVELKAYKHIYKIAENIIGEAFSKAVIQPGETTTQDIEYWIMQRINALGLEAWFSPDVDLQRVGVQDKRIFNTIVQPGDVLHCDVGLKYMGLCTDTQRVAYVLRAGEDDVPEGIKKALKVCNSFQDIVTGCFSEGKTGNEILKEALRKAEANNIKAMLYSHPIGYHGHGAGPIIGLFDNQITIPIRGDYPIHKDTCYALELNTAYSIPEWNNQELYIFLEETIAFTKEGVSYMGERQREFIVVHL